MKCLIWADLLFPILCLELVQFACPVKKSLCMASGDFYCLFMPWKHFDCFVLTHFLFFGFYSASLLLLSLLLPALQVKENMLLWIPLQQSKKICWVFSGSKYIFYFWNTFVFKPVIRCRELPQFTVILVRLLTQTSCACETEWQSRSVILTSLCLLSWLGCLIKLVWKRNHSQSVFNFFNL